MRLKGYNIYFFVWQGLNTVAGIYIFIFNSARSPESRVRNTYEGGPSYLPFDKTCMRIVINLILLNVLEGNMTYFFLLIIWGSPKVLTKITKIIEGQTRMRASEPNRNIQSFKSR